MQRENTLVEAMTNQDPTFTRVLVALALAPIVPGFVMGIVSLVGGGHIAFMFFPLAAAVFGYPVAFGVGLPAFMFLSKTSKGLTAIRGIALGAMLGALAPLWLPVMRLFQDKMPLKQPFAYISEDWPALLFLPFAGVCQDWCFG